MRVLGYIKRNRPGLLAVAGVFVILLGASADVFAADINVKPTPAPGVGSYGLEATKLQPPPTTTATITTPANGASFTDSPITVSGLCTDGLLVQIYDNGVMVGAVMCENGSFSIQASLFTGQNDFSTFQFDDLGQSSPAGNSITVTYNNLSLHAFGTLVTLTSNYGRRAADPGQILTWPLQVSGGTGPYAFSTNWGDGADPDLKSAPLAGEVQISHVYDRAGIYRVTVKVTDVNGVSAFLQLVAIANGQPAAITPAASTKTITIIKVTWWPVAIVVALMPLTYWLGRRSQLVSLHKKLEKEVENYKDL